MKLNNTCSGCLRVAEEVEMIKTEWKQMKLTYVHPNQDEPRILVPQNFITFNSEEGPKTHKKIALRLNTHKRKLVVIEVPDWNSPIDLTT